MTAIRATAPRGAAKALSIPVRTRAIALFAQDEPLVGVASPRTHQRYRHPRLELTERRLPDVVPGGHVRVRMLVAGICGTDVHLSEADPTTGYIVSSVPASIPGEGRVIGHEGVGEIIAVGEHARGLKPGDHVAFESIMTCGNCEYCRRGHPNQCRNARLLGTEIDGLFSEYADVPAVLARRIEGDPPGENLLTTAACLEPASVAMLACHASRPKPGDRVVVQGAGPIGALIAMYCRKVFGCSRVEVIDPVPLRRERAAAFADAVFTPEEYLARASTADVIFEASGDLAYTSRLIPRLLPNGRLCLLARSGTPFVLDNVDHVITGNISITGVRGHLGGIFEEVMRLQESGRVNIGDVVTGVVDGLDALWSTLSAPREISSRHCKLLCRIARP